MAWLYVPASVASTSGSSSRSGTPTAPCVTWRGKLIAPKSWPGAWKRAISTWRLSGTISAPSMASRGVESWISSLAASRANRGVTRGSVKEQPTIGGCGTSSPESSGKSYPLSFSWRMFRVSLVGGSNTSSPPFPTSGTMRNGICSARPTWGRRTKEHGYSSWPTCTVWDDHLGLHKDKVNEFQVGHIIAQATFVRLWAIRGHRVPGPPLLHWYVNPRWRERLMGLPPGWTRFEPLETASFREWSRLHFTAFSAACMG